MKTLPLIIFLCLSGAFVPAPTVTNAQDLSSILGLLTQLGGTTILDSVLSNDVFQNILGLATGEIIPGLLDRGLNSTDVVSLLLALGQNMLDSGALPLGNLTDLIGGGNPLDLIGGIIGGNGEIPGNQNTNVNISVYNYFFPKICCRS